jgi:hypothetical protein
MDLRRCQILLCIGEGRTSRPDLRIDDVVKPLGLFGRASGIQKSVRPGRPKNGSGRRISCDAFLASLYPFTSVLAVAWGIASFPIARSFSATETTSLALNQIRRHSEDMLEGTTGAVS